MGLTPTKRTILRTDMITLKDFMEVVGYRITEGSDYGWQCFGYSAYRLDSWDGNLDGHTVSIVFDTKTQEVYEVEAFDYANDRAFRMINPAYREAFNAESEDREIIDMAWEKDDGTPVKYIDLESAEDFLEKASAIVAGEEYDVRVQVPLNLEKDMLYDLMLMAHERDLTLNQLVEVALVAAIEDVEAGRLTKEDAQEFVRVNSK